LSYITSANRQRGQIAKEVMSSLRLLLVAGLHENNSSDFSQYSVERRHIDHERID